MEAKNIFKEWPRENHQILQMKSKKKPEISIIMNCYNGEQYLRKSLSSIINQTYKNWELIFWRHKSFPLRQSFCHRAIVICLTLKTCPKETFPLLLFLETNFCDLTQRSIIVFFKINHGLHLSLFPVTFKSKIDWIHKFRGQLFVLVTRALQQFEKETIKDLEEPWRGKRNHEIHKLSC